MDLTEAEILQLGENINLAISSVSNVDQILQDTNADLQRANALRQSADDTEQSAKGQLEHAEKVTRELGEALEAQNRADIAIQQAQEDIDASRADLSQVKNLILNIEQYF